jgi:hypothetical protein
MTAFNVVRFRVKPGQEQAFVEAHRQARPKFKGFVDGWLVKTGESTFCVVAQWRTFQSIVNARPEMIGLLDGMRDMLEDLGGGLGVTDPLSGDAVMRLRAPKAATKKKRRPARATPTKKKTKKKQTKRR